jgi:hypothetical protein
MKRTIVIALAALVAFGCEKAELPKPVTATPSANTIQVSMGGDYANQLFFDLGSGSVVLQNNREIWDLGFACGADGRNIILNSSKFMAMSKTSVEDLALVTSATPVEWHYDSQSGKEDSLAFSDWELNRVYVVDRGNTTTGQAIGKLKLQIIGHDANGYTIRWGATLNATTFETTVIAKSDSHNFVFFSFASGGTVTVEPPKETWDLCFTSYTYNFHDGTPYLVTGLLSNRHLVRVAESELPFEDVDFAYASTIDYPADIDVIGYDWKVYDFDLSIYTIDFSRVYVVRSVEGLYYKLRFLDFYDNMGVKGAPTFELQEIVP